MILSKIATLVVIGSLGTLAQLSGCSSSGTVNINDVIADAQAACAFVPTTQTVESELNANPTITNATAIAAVICSAIGTVHPATSAAPSTVDKTWVVTNINGKEVPITGHFSS